LENVTPTKGSVVLEFSNQVKILGISLNIDPTGIHIRASDTSGALWYAINLHN
jgi:hypothetical protein